MPDAHTPNTLELHLRRVEQLFNSMDPSPFHEKDLDRDAEQFIAEWASEPHHEEGPYRIRIHLEQLPEDGDPKHMVTEAIHNYFGYQAKLQRGLFSQMMRNGRRSLVIGALFIMVCITAAGLMQTGSSSHFMRALAESLTVAGWVAMWRPMEVFLYDWWPLRRKIRIFERLSRADIRVLPQPAHA